MPHRTTRRDLLALAGAGMVPTTLFAQQPAAPSGGPDLVVFNARVVTIDSRQPRAESFASSTNSLNNSLSENWLKWSKLLAPGSD